MRRLMFSGLAGEASNAAAFPSLHSLIIDTATELRRLQDRLQGATQREAFPELATANRQELPAEQQQQQQQPQRSRPQQL